MRERSVQEVDDDEDFLEDDSDDGRAKPQKKSKSKSKKRRASAAEEDDEDEPASLVEVTPTKPCYLICIMRQVYLCSSGACRA